MVQLNFDATNAPQMRELSAVPAGWYNVMISKSEPVATKDGTGMFLKIDFDILDGQYKGQKLFTRLNIRNTNPQAVEIAYQELSSIAHACGVMQVADSQQLHGIPLKVKVKVRKDSSGEHDDQNVITSYKNASAQVDMGLAGGPVGGAQAQQWQQPAQQPAQQQWQQPAQQPPMQAQQPAQQQQPFTPPQQFQPPVQQQFAPQQQVQQQQPAQQVQQPHPAQGEVPPWLRQG